MFKFERFEKGLKKNKNKPRTPSTPLPFGPTPPSLPSHPSGPTAQLASPAAQPLSSSGPLTSAGLAPSPLSSFSLTATLGPHVSSPLPPAGLPPPLQLNRVPPPTVFPCALRLPTIKLTIKAHWSTPAFSPLFPFSYSSSPSPVPLSAIKTGPAAMAINGQLAPVATPSPSLAL
jgi:hypothetical protein